MLGGLLKPTRGEAQVVGLDLRRATGAAKGQLGYMAQKFSLYGLLSVRQNLEFSAGVYGLKGAARQARIDVILADIRPAAVAEMTALGTTPQRAMRQGLARSDWPATRLPDGVPVCLFGAAPVPLTLGTASGREKRGPSVYIHAEL